MENFKSGLAVFVVMEDKLPKKISKKTLAVGSHKIMLIFIFIGFYSDQKAHNFPLSTLSQALASCN